MRIPTRLDGNHELGSRILKLSSSRTKTTISLVEQAGDHRRRVSNADEDHHHAARGPLLDDYFLTQ